MRLYPGSYLTKHARTGTGARAALAVVILKRRWGLPAPSGGLVAGRRKGEIWFGHGSLLWGAGANAASASTLGSRPSLLWYK